ncbi:MAG TPA: thermosome subunit [Methanoculleus sp.]|nr:thermosome subunit [Methanoculleus sp.]
MSEQTQQPIIILKEGTERKQGNEAQRENITAARAVAEAVRTTLGPRGMDKMLVDTIGSVVITNDGITILEELEIQHPAAKMMVEVAKTQNDEVGDGTTSAVVMAGELLRYAEELLEQDVHPSTIAQGFILAADRSLEILDSIAIDVGTNDEVLRQVAATAINGKGAEAENELFCDIAVNAIKLIADDDGTVDTDFIGIERLSGGSAADSRLIEGVVIDKERVNANMPASVKQAGILLLNAPIEYKKTEMDAEISITSSEQLQAFLNEEERMIKAVVDRIIETGTKVIFCQKGIDDMAEHFLAKAGIMAVRRVKKSDMERLSRATGASIISSMDAISKDEIGFAGRVEEKGVAGKRFIFVTDCTNPKAATILVHGGTKTVAFEMERAMDDALHVVATTFEDQRVVPGGGAPEIELSVALRDYATRLGGRTQLAVEAFARAFERIPLTLAENAGFDPIDTLIELRTAHERGESTAGIDVATGTSVDMISRGIVDPLRVKTQAVASAAEAATMILRIDDVISAAAPKPGELPPQAAGMGGMGMPPMM